MSQHTRIGVGVGQADAQVDHPPAPGRVGDQAGVVAGIGHRWHGLDQGMQERPAAHVGQLAAVAQLPQHRHRVGGLAPVGQPQHGPPDGPMGGSVEVDLLEHGGDLDPQPPTRQNRSQHRLLGLQVVRRLSVGLGHRTQPAPGPRRAGFGSGHRRGRRTPLPRLRWG
jgi:hypothetical protein